MGFLVKYLLLDLHCSCTPYTIIYGCLVKWKTTNKRYLTKKLSQIQKLTSLLVYGALKSNSTEALDIIFGFNPINTKSIYFKTIFFLLCEEVRYHYKVFSGFVRGLYFLQSLPYHNLSLKIPTSFSKYVTEIPG